MRGVFQATVVDGEGNVLPLASVEVRSESTGNLVQVYDAITAGSELGNPFSADANGFFIFYAEEGLYRIDATLDAETRTWRHVLLSSGIESGEFEGTLSGMAAATTGTIQWRRNGNTVTLFSTNAIVGTSNSSSMLLTGMPEQIRPATAQIVLCDLIENNSSSNNSCSARILTSGTITFGQLVVQDIGGGVLHVRSSESSFTNSSTKGITAGWTIRYELT